MAAITGLLLCGAGTAHAQAPSCAWGNGIALPGGDTRSILATSDGGSGLLAITSELYTGIASTIRLHHVLEQGRLDPSMQADGAVIMSPALVPDHPVNAAVRAVADESGGVYVLIHDCISTLPHTPCYDAAELRLLHVTAQGTTVPGWPAAGVVLNARSFPIPRDFIDIVPDGGGGVIAAWVEGPNWYFATPVRAQRFAFGGTTLWPGDAVGLEVLAAQTDRENLRLAGDGAGGCVVVVSQEIVGSTHYELKAGRVDTSGGLPWTSAGKLVMTQPVASATVQAVVMDPEGRSFVTALVQAQGLQQHFWSQLLNSAGSRLWTVYGLDLGVGNSANSPAFAGAAGFFSVHGDAGGTPLFQLQEVTGTPFWNDGIAADWVDAPGNHHVVATAEGHVVSLWQGSASSPPIETRAIELDENGSPPAGWPSPWAVVCADNAGRTLQDAFVSGGHVYVAWGSNEAGVQPLVQRLSRAVLDAPEARIAHALELAPPSPNPSRGAASVRVSVRDPVAATLEAFDVAGRRVLARDLGVLSAGPHVVSVETGALAPGLYRLRVRAGGLAAERVLIRIR